MGPGTRSRTAAVRGAELRREQRFFQVVPVLGAFLIAAASGRRECGGTLVLLRETTTGYMRYHTLLLDFHRVHIRGRGGLLGLEGSGEDLDPVPT